MQTAPLPARPYPLRVGGLWLVLFLLSLFAVGCGERLPPLAPVKGKVTVDGKALTSGNVMLHPEGADTSTKVPNSAGQIGANGDYEIFTGGKSGAPLVKYKVTVTPDMSKPGDKAGDAIVENYRLIEKTPLKVEVIDSPEAGRYDLKLKK